MFSHTSELKRSIPCVKGETGVHVLPAEEYNKYTLARPQPQNKDLNDYTIVVLHR